jgi:hypothetical protein
MIYGSRGANEIKEKRNGEDGGGAFGSGGSRRPAMLFVAPSGLTAWTAKQRHSTQKKGDRGSPLQKASRAGLKPAPTNSDKSQPRAAVPQYRRPRMRRIPCVSTIGRFTVRPYKFKHGQDAHATATLRLKAE